MFAVIKTGGRQYRVVPDDVLEIGKIAGMSGRSCSLAKFCWSAVNRPCLAPPRLRARAWRRSAAAQARPKVISFKKRRRKNSRRKRGYRDEITVRASTEILTNDNKPTIGPRPKREKPLPAGPVDGDDEAPKAVKKKATPKKAVAKKAAAKRAKPLPRRLRPRRPRPKAKVIKSEA